MWRPRNAPIATNVALNVYGAVVVLLVQMYWHVCHDGPGQHRRNHSHGLVAQA